MSKTSELIAAARNLEVMPGEDHAMFVYRATVIANDLATALSTAQGEVEAYQQRALAICDDWLAVFGLVDIVHTDARTYATDTLKDIRDALAALPNPPQGGDGT